MEELALAKKDKKIYKLLTLGTFLIEFVYGVYTTVWSVLLPYMMNYYHVSVAEIGASTSLFGVGGILGVLTLMYLLDRFSKPKALCIIVVVFVISMFMHSIAPEFIILPIAFCLAGASTMAIDTINAAIIVDIYGDESKTYVNILQGMFAIGCILGPVFAQFIIGIGLGWNVTYLCFVYAMMAALALYALVVFINKGTVKRLKKASHETKTGNELSIRQFIKRKEVILTVCAVFLASGSQGLSQGWMVKYLKEDLLTTAVISTIAATIFYVGLAISRFSSPVLYKKFEPLKLLAVLLGIGGLIVFGTYISENPYLIIIGSLFFGFAVGTAIPGLVANLCSFFPGQSGRASSFIFIGMGIAGVFFSFFTAAIITWFGLKTCIVLSSFFILGTVPFIVMLMRINNARGKVEIEGALEKAEEVEEEAEEALKENTEAIKSSTN